MATAFTVARKPLSINAKHPKSYVQSIADAARSKHHGGLFSEPLYSRILWFHRQSSNQGDIDNLSKTIHDALKQIIFEDDHWITHTLAIRVDISEQVEILPDPNNPEVFVELTELLGVPHVLYVEIGIQPKRKIQLGPLTP